jgi:hypothetical protein
MFKLKVKLKKNTKEWDKMKARLLKTTPRQIDVGWFEDATYPNGIPVAWIAMLNEYGYMTTGKYEGYHPPRPFFRVFLKEYVTNTVLMNSNIAPKVAAVAEGRMTWAALHRDIGQQLVDWVKKKILETNSPHNTPLTVSLKGFDDPLIETGRMYDTVRYKLSRKARS